MFAGNGSREEEVASEPLFNIGEDVPTLKKGKKSAGKKKSQQTKNGKGGGDGEMVPTSTKTKRQNCTKTTTKVEWKTGMKMVTATGCH